MNRIRAIRAELDDLEQRQAELVAESDAVTPKCMADLPTYCREVLLPIIKLQTTEIGGWDWRYMAECLEILLEKTPSKGTS